jgi:NADH-quinone oxidoreductase subunit L
MYFTTFFGPERIELGDEHHGDADEEHQADHAHAEAAPAHGHPAHTHVHADGSVHIHESPAVMTLPLIALAVGSAIAGFWMNGGAIPHPETTFARWLAPAIGGASGHGAAGAEATHAAGALSEEVLIGLSIAAGVIGIVVAYAMHVAGVFYKGRRTALGEVIDRRYGYEGLLHAIFVRAGGALSWALWKVVDVGIIDGIVNGVGGAITAGARALRVLQTGYVRNYALVMLAGAAVVVGVFVWMIR